MIIVHLVFTGCQIRLMSDTFLFPPPNFLRVYSGKVIGNGEQLWLVRAFFNMPWEVYLFLSVKYLFRGNNACDSVVYVADSMLH